MNRKNRLHFHEPANLVPDTEEISGEIPVEDTLEVGAIMLIEEPMPNGIASSSTVFFADGSADPIPRGVSDALEASEMIEFGIIAEYTEAEQANPYTAGGYMEETPPMTGSTQDTMETVKNKAEDLKDKAEDLKDKAADVKDAVQDKAQGMAQNISSTAHTIASKAQDAAQTVASKAQNAAQTIAGKAEDAKAAAADAGQKSKSVIAGAAGTVGMGLWSIVQRSPLQTIFFLSSLIWLLCSNGATASQTPVSVGEAAEKVGTLSGQVQVTAGSLGTQVKTSAQQGAGWFSTTMQENPLVIGAIALAGGLALGLVVPETAYENKTLGKTRDQLLDKATEAASDLTHKVTAVAQTAAREAVETAKTEAKNQGLTASDKVQSAPEQPQQAQQQ